MIHQIRSVCAVSTLALLVATISVFGQTSTRWSALGTGLFSRFPLIYSIVPLGDNVYVGGIIERAGGVSASMIARWNWADQRWYALGGGVNSNVFAIVPIIRGSDTVLAVGGAFDFVDGNIPCSNLALWNTRSQQWECLVDSLGGTDAKRITGLYYDEQKLYVCGYFSSINGIPSSGLATYDFETQSWQSLGFFEQRDDSLVGEPLINGVVRVGHELYAYGAFTHVDGIRSVGMARYDLQSHRWDSVPGARFKVGAYDALLPNAVVRVGDSLIIGGEFGSFGQISNANCLITYNTRTQQWSQFAGGVWRDTAQSSVKYYAVFSLLSDGKRIYVGGSFDQAGTIPARNVAVYDLQRAAWDSLESGTNGRVTALALDNRWLYAAGGFLNVGAANIRANYIAAWMLDTTATSVTATPKVTTRMTSNGQTLCYVLDEAGPVTIAIYDLRGNRLQTLCKTFQPPGSYTEAMPALPAGMYYVQLRTIRSVVTIPVVVLP